MTGPWTVRQKDAFTVLPAPEIVPASTFSILRHLPFHTYFVFDPPHSVSA